MVISIREHEVDIIARTRSEVLRHKELTGENLFLAWGYPTAILLLMEFASLQLWHKDWCSWLWIGIPLVGAPLMFYFLNKDYSRTHRRTLTENTILVMWIFIGCASCVGGTVMGFAGVFPICYCSFQGLLIGMGCFMTGVVMHFRPKTVCGIIASLLSALPFFFQGDLWPWQLLIASLIAVVALIIPGHLFRRYARKVNSNNV